MFFIDNTYRSWLTFKVSSDLSNLEMTSNLYDHENLSFQESVSYTSNLIKQTNKNIYVSLSGGLDSEFVAESLRRNGVPFTAIGFVNPFNTLEIEYAYHYCEKHNIPAIWLSCNKDKMFSLSRVLAKKHGIDLFPNWIPQFFIDTHLSDKNALIVDGNCHMINDPHPTPFQIEIVELYVDIFGKSPRIHFFNHTIEIFKSLMQEIDITKKTQAAKAELFGLPFRPKMFGNLSQLLGDDSIKERYLEIKKLVTRDKKINKEFNLEIVEESRTI